jgi:hypothetical protein
MIYGQTKLFKTSTYLAAPPSLRPMAVLDADRGAKMRLRVLSMSQEEREKLGVKEPVPEHYGPWIAEGIDFYYPDPANWYADCFEFCTKIAPDYKLVVPDTLSRIAEKILDEVKGINYEGTDKQTKRIKVSKGGVETIHPTMSDYGFAQDRVMELVTALDDSPAHVLLITHEKTGEVRDTEAVKRVLGGPRTVGNALIEVLPSIVDVVLRFEPRSVIEDGKQAIKTAIRTRNHNFYLAGDRSGLFEDGEILDTKVFWEKLQGTIQMGLNEPQAQGGK